MRYLYASEEEQASVIGSFANSFANCLGVPTRYLYSWGENSADCDEKAPFGFVAFSDELRGAGA